MEAQTAQPPTSAGSSSTAYPRWVMLEHYCSLDDDSAADDYSAADDDWAADDAKTMAVTRTSAGHTIQVSLYVEAPLATATVRIQVPDDGRVEVVERDCVVVAAHGDSLLIRVGFDDKQYQQGYTTDHFVYNDGDAAAAAGPQRPPTLSLLPPCYDDEDKRVRRRLGPYALGLLRRGEDELVVAELRTARPVPELCLFHSSSGEWTVKRVPISYSDVLNDAGEACWERLPSVWITVVPVGDRLLCWVYLPCEVVVICDGVFDESPRMLYLRLPMDPCLCSGMPLNENRNVCATDAYKGLPCVPLDHAVVSMDKPHVIYFQLCPSHHVKVKDGGDHTLWLLKVDMRSKTIQSVSRYEDWFPYMDDILIPSNVSHFLNSYPSDGTGSLAH